LQRLTSKKCHAWTCLQLTRVSASTFCRQSFFFFFFGFRLEARRASLRYAPPKRGENTYRGCAAVGVCGVVEQQPTAGHGTGTGTGMGTTNSRRQSHFIPKKKPPHNFFQQQPTTQPTYPLPTPSQEISVIPGGLNAPVDFWFGGAALRSLNERKRAASLLRFPTSIPSCQTFLAYACMTGEGRIASHRTRYNKHTKQPIFWPGQTVMSRPKAPDRRFRGKGGASKRPRKKEELLYSTHVPSLFCRASAVAAAAAASGAAS